MEMECVENRLDKLNKEPFLNYIEKLIKEYKKLKRNLAEKTDLIANLTRTNLDLRNTITELKHQLQIASTEANKKRRKTNSPEVQMDDDSKLRDNSICDKFNVAISTTLMNESDIFDSPIKSVHKTPKKGTDSSNHVPSKVLSPVNTNCIATVKKLQLPRRLKTTENNENEKPKLSEIKNNSTTWEGMSFIQPNRVNKTPEKLNISGDVIACSQEVSNPRKKDKKSVNLRLKQSKLEFNIKSEKVDSVTVKQNKNTNETFCEDVVKASPTATTSSARKLTRKKSDENLFIFHGKKSPSSLSIAPSTSRKAIETIKPFEMKKEASEKNIQYITKEERNQFYDHLLTDDTFELTGIDNANLSKKSKAEELNKNNENLTNLLSKDSSSVFVLPSEPDDVIIVDESEQYNLNSIDLLAEIMSAGNKTQPILKKLEEAQIKTIQNSLKNNIDLKSSSKSTVTNEINFQNKISDVFDDDNDFTVDFLTKDESKRNLKNCENSSNKYKAKTNESDLHHKLSEIFNDDNDFTIEIEKKEQSSKQIIDKDQGYCSCNDCQLFKKYMIQHNVPPDEMKRRLKNCKKSVKLHLTPDGFWDPCFEDFPPDDPRNKIHTVEELHQL